MGFSTQSLFAARIRGYARDAHRPHPPEVRAAVPDTPADSAATAAADSGVSTGEALAWVGRDALAVSQSHPPPSVPWLAMTGLPNPQPTGLGKANEALERWPGSGSRTVTPPAAVLAAAPDAPAFPSAEYVSLPYPQMLTPPP